MTMASRPHIPFLWGFFLMLDSSSSCCGRKRRREDSDTNWIGLLHWQKDLICSQRWSYSTWSEENNILTYPSCSSSIRVFHASSSKKTGSGLVYICDKEWEDGHNNLSCLEEFSMLPFRLQCILQLKEIYMMAVLIIIT